MAVLTILIVDDEANQRLLIGQVLAGLEYDCQILHAASAAEALGYLTSSSISLIITDYQMPSMTGLDLVAALRLQHNATPVILISAYNLDEVRSAAQTLQIEHVLAKPFPIDHLRRLATELLLAN